MLTDQLGIRKAGRKGRSSFSLCALPPRTAVNRIWIFCHSPETKTNPLNVNKRRSPKQSHSRCRFIFFFAVGNVHAVLTHPPAHLPPIRSYHCVYLALMVGERRAGVGEGRVGLSSPGPLFLSDPHSGSFSMWHLWGHGASLMAPRSHKCASSLRSALSQDGKEKGEDGRGRDGIINKEMKQDKHIIVDWWWEKTDMRGKKTEGWGEKTNLSEEGAYTSMWDLRKACVYLKWWPGSTAYSHGHSCLGIKRNMRKSGKAGKRPCDSHSWVCPNCRRWRQ